MTELLNKGERLTLRIPRELKDRLASLDCRLRASFKRRNKLEPSYANSLSIAARAALERGIEAMEQAISNGSQKKPCQNPRKNQG